MWGKKEELRNENKSYAKIIDEKEVDKIFILICKWNVEKVEEK